MDRNIRNLIHKKGSKVKVVQSPPMISDGEDGDIYLYGLGTSGILYVKGFGKWWHFKSTDLKGHGWHGSTSRVKILPTQFLSSDRSYSIKSSYAGYIMVDTGSDFTDGEIHAHIVVPHGYKLRGYRINTIADSDDSGIHVTIYENFISSGGSGSSLGTGDVNQYITCTSISSNDNYFTIRLINLHETTQIRGGYLDIAGSLTPELISQGATSEDGLFRG